MTWLLGASLVGTGVAIGWIAEYFLLVKPRDERIYWMRKRGYMPIEKVEQETEEDPASDIPEW